MPHKVLQRTYSTRFNDFALEFYSFVADNYAPFYSRPIECTDRDAPFVPRRRALPRERPRPRRALHRHPWLHRDQLRRLRDGRHALLPAHPQPAPPAHLLRRPGARPRRPRAGSPARKAGGELPPHRRAVGPHRPVLRGVPRRPRHRVGRAPEVQPLPGVEPLLRRQPRARPRAEDPNSCCSTCPNPNCGPRCGGGCSRSSSCTPWPAPSTTGSGAASALARSTTQVNACSCLTLILACIIYWQAREISRIAAAPDFPFDPDLLRHVSPIEWNLVGTLLWDRQAGAFGCRVHRPYARRDPRRPRRGVRRGRREGAFQTSGPGENSMNRPNAAA